MYTVYVHKNLKNEKYYVGMTSQEPKERWASGWGYHKNSQMWKDIQESNWNTDWVHGILGKFDNKQDALNYEAFLIAMLDSVNNGYNTSSFNNSNYKRTEEHRKKISESLTGRTLSEEMKNKIRENTPSKPVIQFSKTGEFIAEYSSSRDAEHHTGCNQSNIIKCCKGKIKSTGGFIWRYED